MSVNIKRFSPAREVPACSSSTTREGEMVTEEEREGEEEREESYRTVKYPAIVRQLPSGVRNNGVHNLSSCPADPR